jgi:hypothetical protein
VPSPRVRWIVAGIVVMLLVGAASAQIALLLAHPVARGSISWSFPSALTIERPSHVVGKCRGFEPTSTTSLCTEVAFAPGAPVGVGFSVRNNGPLPVTVVSVASLGAESPIMLAELHPVLSPVGATFAIDETRPFEPIEIAPGKDVTIVLTGRIRACDAVRGHWDPGVTMGWERVRLTVRWLLVSSEVDMPLQQTLQIGAPAESQCP